MKFGMDYMVFIKIILLFALLDISVINGDSNESVVSEFEDTGATKVLSRRKRYLVFPDGSSFQLVICEQNHGYLQLGDIVWFGNTAALAWELPTDPELFLKTKGYFGLAQKRQDNKHIVFFDEKGKILAKVPYRKKLLVNPAFAKRSVNARMESNVPKKMSIKELHEIQKNRDYLKDLDESSRKFHREGRKSFYERVEKLLEGLGWRGKECILRLLCENAKAKTEQGTFVEEIIKASFTFPRSAKFEDLHKEYDEAHSAKGDCEKLYPECEDQKELI